MFFGAESLAGYAITRCRPAIDANISESPGLLPIRRMQYEKSAAAYPIMRAGFVAGAFVVSSTQPNYFQAPSHQALAQGYADLMLLAFEPEEFYDPQQVLLRIMPSHEIQISYFASFRHRVATVIRQAALNGKTMNALQAEKLVWQQLEEELTQL